jgi:hypothetical protein
MMWRGANIEVIDLGTNVSAERFVEAAREHDAHSSASARCSRRRWWDEGRRDGDQGGQPAP